MKIDAYFSVPEFDPAAIGDATVVVIDVVRATTTIIEALANGARAIYPTASTEEAVKLASSLGREDTLLCGERKGHKVEGFDLGNSPLEFTREAVSGKRLVMSTTNGTRALSVGLEAVRILPCAFTNLGAVAEAVAEDEHVVVVCAGRGNRFGFDDALCAGHLIRRIVGSGDGVDHDLNDAALAASALAVSRGPTREFLSDTAAGANLLRIGMGDDLDVCVDLDRHAIVAELSDKAIKRTET